MPGSKRSENSQASTRNKKGLYPHAHTLGSRGVNAALTSSPVLLGMFPSGNSIPEVSLSGSEKNINPEKPIPPEIVRYLEIFSGEQRGVVQEHANCSKRLPLELENILVERGVPREILNIAFLESRFHPSIRSPRGDTVGMWQLAEATARKYGLVVNRKKDERKDPVKATTAAAQMLSELREKFGNWPLALAAYNSGPFRVEQAIKDSGGETSIFTLTARGLLSQTTSDYLARFAALTLILKDPTRYGFAENVGES